MKTGKIFQLREKLLNTGYIKAKKDFQKETLKQIQLHNQFIEELEKVHNKDQKRLSGIHRKNLKDLENNYKLELKSLEKRSTTLNERLTKKISMLDDALEVRDAEIVRLRQITEQALMEQSRRNAISDRVLKEASMLRKTENELKALTNEATYVAKKSDKKLKLVQ